MNNNKQQGLVRRSFSEGGFTLIEILVVIGMIAILATIVIIAINPARQFAQGRNTQRTSNVNAVLNAIGQNIADNKGKLNCPFNGFGDASGITTTGSDIKSDGHVDLMPCLVPTYISSVLADPSNGTSNGTSSYDTAYTISEDANGRYTVCAPKTNEPNTSAQEDICITR
jgi:type IV pilus assembly protein PilA